MARKSREELEADTRARQERMQLELDEMKADRAAHGGWRGDLRETLAGTLEDVVLFVVLVVVIGGGALVGRAADDSTDGLVAGAAIGAAVALVLLLVRYVVRRRR